MSMSVHAAWPQIPTATATLPPAPEIDLALSTPSGASIPLGARLAIGQAPSNDLALDDACASRRHCVIEHTASGPCVRDLGSKNGTYVNDVRIIESPLYAGAVLTVGQTRLRVVAATRARSPLLGESRAMRSLRRSITMLAPTALPLLIVGETGTGKELVARALHDESGRSGSFIALNCGAIAAELVESELFGHERGAFTGATQKRLGVFQEADQGTLFLDEVGELPLALQPRLLRALEVGAVRPVGATREQAVTVRVVAATHVDLEEAVRTGRFREDLYYRLCGDLVRTPSLRERPEDIRIIAERVIADLGNRVSLTDDALASLAEYAWPGNVRELRNVLQRAAALHGPRLSAEDLALRPATIHRTDSDKMEVSDRPYLELEREILSRAIRRSGGNKRAAAHALGIPKSTLCDKAKRFGIT